MGKQEELNISVKKKVSACRDQFPVASEQNTPNHCSLLWDKPISQGCNGDILREKNKWEDLISANIKKR
jgi:hypothetical protein